MNILFLCTGNSCRSVIAEALFRAVVPAGVTVQSAGSKPTGFIHPRALAVLEKSGVSTKGLRSKSWDELPEKPDVVVTLCADAAGESCPVYFGKVVRSHWGLPDPAQATGDEAAINEAFARTAEVLQKRATALALLPFHTLKNDEPRLQAALDAIAEQYR